jgi:hypothetical protein
MFTEDQEKYAATVFMVQELTQRDVSGTNIEMR